MSLASARIPAVVHRYGREGGYILLGVLGALSGAMMGLSIDRNLAATLGGAIAGALTASLGLGLVGVLLGISACIAVASASMVLAVARACWWIPIGIVRLAWEISRVAVAGILIAAVIAGLAIGIDQLLGGQMGVLDGIQRELSARDPMP